MNILVKTAAGKIVVRPDTTWEKDNEDLYVPEFVDSLSWTPVLFARISKPGRSVGLKFADRYYDGVSFGMLLYPDELMDGSEEGFACASCLDHTSFLPYPVYPKDMLEKEVEFKINVGKDEISSVRVQGLSIIEEAIVEATKFCYIRTGDIIAIELKPRGPLCRRQDERCEVSASLCGNNCLVFNIVY